MISLIQFVSPFYLFAGVVFIGCWAVKTPFFADWLGNPQRVLPPPLPGQSAKGGRT